MEIVVPSASESITEVFIGQWYVSEGEFVEKDGPIVEIESEKASMDIPAPEAGRITQVLIEEGETAEVGQVIAHLEPGDAPAGDAGQQGETAPSETAGGRPAGGQQATPPSGSNSDGFVMPAAARVMAEKGLPAGSVAGSGPGGRVLKEDAQTAKAAPPSRSDSGGAGASGSGQKAGSGAAALSVPSSGEGGGREQKQVAMSPIRRTIARRLVEAQQTAALLTTFNEIDMSGVMALRKEHQESFVARYDTKLGFMSFFVKAVCEALAEFPSVGAIVEGDSLVYSNYADIGVAVGGGKALVVPVLRNAERMGFAEIEQRIKDFGRRARDNDITAEEMQGGTFTITNGGVYGSLLSTPIVNPPQSGVLGMHNIVERPVAIEGQVVIRPMMYVALTYDHRVVDGREAVQFLVRIKDVIENPVRLILEV